jgi:hypothetical protein
MKHTTILSILSLAIPSIAIANEMPDIKPGLWEIETSVDGTSEGKTLQCMDEKTSKEIMSASTKMLGDQCKDIEIKKSAGTYVSKIDCNLGPSRMLSTSVLSGDFKTSFNVKAESSFTPPFMGQGKSTSVSNAKYLGACKDGMEPGDAIMPDGTKINITKSMESMPDLSQLHNMQKALQSGDMQEMMKNMPNLEELQKQMQRQGK